ncbi:MULTISPECIES: hypothetical protein [unclassified Psychrobacillus]|uniref:hypothetical protein n=1 Tax=Psychrobacillus TaxID=1221880 RepID=UPI0030F82867
MRENKFIFIFLVVVMVALGIYVAFSIPEEELKGVLVSLAQLNVAISVGVGALSIGYAQDKKLQSKLTEATIVIAFTSLITFLIAQIDLFLLVNKIYLIINILAMCVVLILTLVVTQESKKIK